MTIYQDFLRHHSRSTDTVVAAVADNCRFDERAGVARWQQFDDLLSEVIAGADGIQWQDWAETDRLHLERYCHVASLNVPDAFLDINQDAWLDELSDNQSAMPTVLDGGMHEFFFPVPREHPYGATVHLSPDLADTLTAELVHCRIDYQRKHLWRLGWIRDPRQLTHEQLRGARDLHLVALQEECGREHFGEFLEGRI